MSAKRKFNSQKQAGYLSAALLTTVGLAGCGPVTLNGEANAQTLPADTAAATPFPTPAPLYMPPTPTPTATPFPTSTPWPTPTPWSAPQAWQPATLALPTLAPVPIALAGQAQVNLMGGVPVSYSPPNGVDVFGSAILRWAYTGQLAADEFFDIRLKPAGSNDLAFVAWSKTPVYELHPWSGWQPGLYTWEIGIIKGALEGDAKHFIADTGRASKPMLIKWQAGGGGNGGGGGNITAGGGNTGGGSTGGGGGGTSSGGS